MEELGVEAVASAFVAKWREVAEYSSFSRSVFAVVFVGWLLGRLAGCLFGWLVG